MAEVREYSLKLSTEQAQGNLDELNKSLELQEDLILDIEKELRQYEKQLLKTSKTDLAARKDVNDKIKVTKERLKDEKIALKAVNKDRKKANKTLKESTANSRDYSGVLGMIDQKTGGLISGMKGMTKSIGGATKGLKLMKVAIIGTGIGALLIAVTSLAAAFTSSEKGQNKFAKIMAVIGSVTGNLVTMLSDLGEKIMSVFSDPKQALIDFKDAIIENVTNRITSLIDTFGYLGSAIKKVFEGDFSGAMDSAKAAGSSFVDTMTGVKGTIDKVSNSVSALSAELIREAKIAGRIADQRAKADKLDRDLIVERAKANRSRAELLEKAVNKELYSAAQRIEFLKEAGKIEDEITAKEIEAAKLRYNAKVAENALANSTKDDLLEEANLKASLINLETAKLTKAKEVTTQIIALNAEEAAALKVIDDERIRLEDEASQAHLEREVTRKGKLNDLMKTMNEQRMNDLADTFEKQAILRQQEAHSQLMELKATAAQKAAIVTYWENKVTEAQDKDKAKKADDDRDVLNAKLSAAATGFHLLRSMAEKDSKLAKGLAIAQATVSGYQAVLNAYTTATKSPITIGFPAYPYVQAGLAGAFALKNIQAIKSTKPTGGGPPPNTNTSAPTVSTPSIPADFNTVGASGTNQLADAIGGQVQRPTRAYVVSTDVTSAQSLDRNIITGATIGG
tara:strand:+ start:5609 stop:7654 length:2046 start_codon:yes stop_codon:yes gene_type:complete